MKTYNGGISWYKNDIPESETVIRIKCINSDICDAITSVGTTYNPLVLKTTNGGGIDTTTAVINTTDVIHFSIYPNPAHTYITISGLSNNQSIKTFDYLGREVSADFNLSLQADITHLPAGIYFTK